MIKSNFKNELNNKITIKLKNVKDENKKLYKKFDALSIVLEGPNSKTENIITKYEGYKLYRMLGNYFENNETKSKIIDIKTGGRKTTMGLSEPHASDVKSGRKIVEGRLNKPPHNTLQRGDILLINNDFKVRIKYVKEYKTFRNMIIKEKLPNVLPSSRTVREGVENVYRKFYPEWKEKKYGVIAIGFELIQT